MSATRILDQVERYVQMLLEERERKNKREKKKVGNNNVAAVGEGKTRFVCCLGGTGDKIELH